MRSIRLFSFLVFVVKISAFEIGVENESVVIVVAAAEDTHNAAVAVAVMVVVVATGVVVVGTVAVAVAVAVAVLVAAVVVVAVAVAIENVRRPSSFETLSSPSEGLHLHPKTHPHHELPSRTTS